LENWKGLGYDIGEEKKRTYLLDKDPTILFYNDSSQWKNRDIKVLRNGMHHVQYIIYWENYFSFFHHYKDNTL
jgi:hypothetical protein